MIDPFTAHGFLLQRCQLSLLDYFISVCIAATSAICMQFALLFLFLFLSLVRENVGRFYEGGKDDEFSMWEGSPILLFAKPFAGASR